MRYDSPYWISETITLEIPRFDRPSSLVVLRLGYRPLDRRPEISVFKSEFNFQVNYQPTVTRQKSIIRIVSHWMQ